MAENLKSIGTGLIIQDPVQFVLSIPLILEKILAELDNKTVFNSRLVSPLWNDAALSIFPKRPIKGQSSRALKLNKMFRSSDIEPNFDARLTKAIEFNGTCSCNGSCRFGTCISTQTKFQKFWGQYSNQIEKVAFRVTSSFASTFSRILSSSGKNLKVFVFDSDSTFDQEDDAELFLEQQFSRLNLHTIDISDINVLPTIFQKPLQALISGAPNLKRLKLGDNFYPDLSNNKKLQHLIQYFHDYFRSWNHKNVGRMYSQVKDSLKTLELGTESEPEITSDPKDFNFPRMPKLKKIRNYDISLNRIGNYEKETLLEILDSKLPALTHLYLRGIGNDVQNCFDKLLGSEQRAQEKILTVGLDVIVNPSIFCHFKEWFPNLRKLDLYLSIPQIEREDDDDEDHFDLVENLLNSTFSKLGQLGLKQLVFRVDFKFLLTDYAKALIKNAELFKSLSSLDLHSKEEYDSMVDDFGKDDDLRKGFCLWLVDVAKSKSRLMFDGFSFSGQTSWEMMSYIRENDLPVKFVNGLQCN